MSLIFIIKTIPQLLMIAPFSVCATVWRKQKIRALQSST
ncbi:hypothetical protein MGSAQ_000973 [marine sediment metagenome]|uniref:Uncharacterized protein n=1 Tax=marine sediment metagenome TaxID=412755 RepID=A0A1B6NW22_9ZZZZ